MKNNMNNINNYKNIIIIPLLTYANADLDKCLIYKENKEKSGIYRWNNLINNKSYVGSSVSLTRRFDKYYSLNAINKKLSNGSSAIYSAILKYGHKNFSLDILEYCKPDILIKREQYYIDILKPEYNILKIAGSILGFKHSESTKIKLSINNTGVKNPRFGKKLSYETKLKMTVNSVRAHKLKVTNISTEDVIVFTSIRATAKFLGMHHSYLAKCLKVNNLYIGKGYNIIPYK